jgi:hypothetical protein
MGGYKIYNNVLKIRFKNEEISSNISSNGFVFRPNLSEKFVSNKLNILDIQSNFVYHNKN